MIYGCSVGDLIVVLRFCRMFQKSVRRSHSITSSRFASDTSTHEHRSF